jgi:DNA-binding transcriptional MerR regulator
LEWLPGIAKKVLDPDVTSGLSLHEEAAVKLGGEMNKETYRVLEFAKLAGVTVRTLHHYDRMGLLKPKQRSSSGYRLYGNRDFGRLEQIVVLKFLGMPLKQIRNLLEKEAKLGEALRRQQRVLAEKRRQIDQAIVAISNAQSSFEAAGEPDWNLFRYVIQEIEMQNNMDWSNKYYSPEAQTKVEERKKLWSPELQERVSRDWAALFSDIEKSLGENPASERAQALAARWRKLVGEFTGGDPVIQEGLNEMWADKPNWPAQAQQNYNIKPEITEFIMKAMKAGK